MEEPSPVPVPASEGGAPSGAQPPVGAPDAEIPLANVARPAALPPDIPFANAYGAQQFVYSTTIARRPGLVTAIGVLAIVIACLSGITSVIGGGQAFMFYTLSKMWARMGNMNFNAMPQTAVATAPVDTNPMSIADSGMVTTVMQERLALDNTRLRELTELLHKHGSALFHNDDNSALSVAAVKDAIVESHKAPDGVSAARFTTSQGTTEVFPDHATFASTDGSTTIRTSAQDHSDSVLSGTAAAATATTMPGYVLQSGEVSRAIAAIRQMQGVTATPAQIATVRRELSNPNQTLVMSNSPQQVYFAFNQPNNDLQITFNNGTLTVAPSGKVVASIPASAQLNPFGTTNMTIPGQWVAVVVIECVASGLLAIYLFIVGIITLRGSLYSPRLLRIYALPKILLASVAGFGVATLIMQSSNAQAGAMNTFSDLAACLLGAGIFVAGIAYPIGLLIALRTQGVRQYFSASEAKPM